MPRDTTATQGHPSHGMTGMAKIMSMACDQKAGYLKMHGPMTGTVEQTFGRLHDAVPVPLPIDEYETKLRTLAESMTETAESEVDGPATAGMAFLGQFIDHDLTLDAMTELGEAAGDVSLIQNFRTPRLDLDCVYGGGPEVSPFLFDADAEGKLLFGRVSTALHPSDNPMDLPRNHQGRALIGDPRNDENLFVSQTHGRKFVARHNELVDQEGSYEDARRELTAEYHAMIVQDFLPQVVDAATLQPFLDWLDGGNAPKTGKVKWDHHKIPDMPVEFSAAAYRFGHSMIRQSYAVNAAHPDEDIFSTDLKGFSPVETAMNLDLDLFFGATAQKSRPIDTKLPAALHQLPQEVVGMDEANLAFRNMQRGHVTFELPSGEDMADHLNVTVIPTHPLVQDAGLAGMTPLWFYILAEAEAGGGKLTGVGGILVAGVLIRLLIEGNSPLSAHTPLV